MCLYAYYNKVMKKSFTKYKKLQFFFLVLNLYYFDGTIFYKNLFTHNSIVNIYKFKNVKHIFFIHLTF